MNDRQDRRGPRGPRREGGRDAGAGKRFGDGGGFRGRPKFDKTNSGEFQSDRPKFGKPRFGKPKSDTPRFDKPRSERPRSDGFGDDRPRFGKPRHERPRFDDDRGDRPRRPQRAEVPRRGDPERLARTDKDGLERIAKVIARAGVASRRDAEALIAEGRVQVNGETISSPALDVAPDADIRVDGEKLPSRERTRLWLFHKPVGLVSTTRDPEGRPTVFQALPEDLPRVMSVGRLDINTEGLLLFTNDGGLARVLSHPETGWLRRYRVRAYGHVDVKRLEALRHGVTIDGEDYGPIVATLDREQGDNTWLTLDMREGKNREVKNVLEHVGLKVNRLIRISFGPFQLGELKEGETEEVKTKVLKEQLGEQLARIAEVEFDGPVRTPAGPIRRERDGDERPRRHERDDGPRRSFRDAERGGRGRFEERGDGEEERKDLLLRKRGGARSEIWRDEQTREMKPRRAAPRRGADPREERRQREDGSAESGRERMRAKPIETAGGRRVVVERVTGPSPEIERKPRYSRDDFRGGRDGGRDDDRPRGRRDFGDRGRDEGVQERPPRRPRPEGERPFRSRDERGGDRPFRSPRGEDRPFRKRFDDERPRREGGDRPFRSRDDDRTGERPRRPRDFEGRPPRRDEPRGERSFGGKPRGERPFREREERGDRPFRGRDERGGDRPFRSRDDRSGERPFRTRDEQGADRPFRAGRPEGKPFGGKSFGGKSFGGKSFGGKSFGGKSSGGRPSGGRPSGGKPFGGPPRDGPRGPRKPR